MTTECQKCGIVWTGQGPCYRCEIGQNRPISEYRKEVLERIDCELADPHLTADTIEVVRSMAREAARSPAPRKGIPMKCEQCGAEVGSYNGEPGPCPNGCDTVDEYGQQENE